MEDLNIDQVKANISSQSAIKLADMVITYRYLGLYKEASILAMEELGKRRASGDDFDFETYIAEKIETLPKLDTNVEFKGIDMGTILSTVKKYLGQK